MNIYIPDTPLMVKVKVGDEIIKGYLAAIQDDIWTVIDDKGDKIGDFKSEDIVK